MTLCQTDYSIFCDGHDHTAAPLSFVQSGERQQFTCQEDSEVRCSTRARALSTSPILINFWKWAHKDSPKFTFKDAPAPAQQPKREGHICLNPCTQFCTWSIEQSPTNSMSLNLHRNEWHAWYFVWLIGQLSDCLQRYSCHHKSPATDLNYIVSTQWDSTQPARLAPATFTVTLAAFVTSFRGKIKWRSSFAALKQRCLSVMYSFPGISTCSSRKSIHGLLTYCLSAEHAMFGRANASSQSLSISQWNALTESATAYIQYKETQILTV